MMLRLLQWTIEELEPAEIPWPSMQYTIRQLREFGASIFQLPTLDQARFRYLPLLKSLFHMPQHAV